MKKSGLKKTVGMLLLGLVLSFVSISWVGLAASPASADNGAAAAAAGANAAAATPAATVSSGPSVLLNLQNPCRTHGKSTLVVTQEGRDPVKPQGLRAVMPTGCWVTLRLSKFNTILYKASATTTDAPFDKGEAASGDFASLSKAIADLDSKLTLPLAKAKEVKAADSEAVGAKFVDDSKKDTDAFNAAVKTFEEAVKAYIDARDAMKKHSEQAKTLIAAIFEVLNNKTPFEQIAIKCNAALALCSDLNGKDGNGIVLLAKADALELSLKANKMKEAYAALNAPAAALAAGAATAEAHAAATKAAAKAPGATKADVEAANKDAEAATEAARVNRDAAHTKDEQTVEFNKKWDEYRHICAGTDTKVELDESKLDPGNSVYAKMIKKAGELLLQVNNCTWSCDLDTSPRQLKGQLIYTIKFDVQDDFKDMGVTAPPSDVVIVDAQASGREFKFTEGVFFSGLTNKAYVLKTRNEIQRIKERGGEDSVAVSFGTLVSWVKRSGGPFLVPSVALALDTNKNLQVGVGVSHMLEGSNGRFAITGGWMWGKVSDLDGYRVDDRFTGTTIPMKDVESDSWFGAVTYKF